MDGKIQYNQKIYYEFDDKSYSSNDYFNLPLLECQKYKLVTILFRRYGYGYYLTIPTESLLNGDTPTNGLRFPFSNRGNVDILINNTRITINSTPDSLYVDLFFN